MPLPEGGNPAYTPPGATDNTGNDQGNNGNQNDGPRGPDNPGPAADINRGTGLPGLEGKDYILVRGPNGRVYAVYSLKLKNGLTMKVAWRVAPKEMKALGINPAKLRPVSGAAFHSINVLGTTTELSLHGDGRHPFNAYLKELRDQFGNPSWMQDAEYMSVMLEGFAENLSEDTIAGMLTQTKWYKSTTEAQRQWEKMGRTDRKAALTAMEARIADALDELYGPDTPYQKLLSDSQIQKWTKAVASGVYGDPSGAGFQVWYSEAKRGAEKVEGTAAWVAHETALFEQRDFMNQPENKYEELRQDALRWLGPQSKNTPYLSKETMKQWATDLVTGKKSEADWNQFLRKQAKAMYPYLGTDQTWMEFADPYKAKLEQLWGRPVDWSNKYLSELTGKDANGVSSGKPMSFDEFELAIRKTPQFWGGRVAKDEGFDLIAKLESIMLGVNN